MLVVKKQSYRDTQRECQVMKEAETGVTRQSLLVLSEQAEARKNPQKVVRERGPDDILSGGFRL